MPARKREEENIMAEKKIMGGKKYDRKDHGRRKIS
jgi:hypothetical protein